MPPRLVRVVLPAGTTGISPYALVGPTTAALSSSTRMPSSDSQKSMPSVAGSNTPLFSTSAVASSSMTVAGGTRPPEPTSVGAGNATPCAASVTDGPVISVTVRFVAVPDGRYSLTVPATVTESPTRWLGAEPTYT
jgi:hypothetical protein